MGVSAKPRKKYRPRSRLQNPMQFALESLSPVRHLGSYVTNWKLKVHSAMVALTQGTATKLDMDTLLAAHYLCGAWIAMDLGTEYKPVLICSHVALADLYLRGEKNQRYIVKALEMQAINDMLSLHDAYLETVTGEQMDRARESAIRNLEHFRPDQVYLPA